MDFEFRTKSNDRALTFQLHGPLVTNLNLAVGYKDPVAGREHQNYKTLQTILQDVSSAISGIWKVVSKAGTVTAPDNADSILNDGRFQFEKAATKLRKKQSLSLWDFLLEVSSCCELRC